MPQLDSATFPSQLVWLVITFVALYLVMWRVALPRVAEVIEQRRRRIDDNLERAGKLKDEAKAVLAAYEKTLAEARAHAQASLAAAGAELAAAAQSRHGELASRLARDVKAAEARIAEARQGALANLAEAAREAARAATARLAGVVPDEPALRAAVDEATRGRGGQ